MTYQEALNQSPLGLAIRHGTHATQFSFIATTKGTCYYYCKAEWHLLNDEGSVREAIQTDWMPIMSFNEIA